MCTELRLTVTSGLGNFDYIWSCMGTKQISLSIKEGLIRKILVRISPHIMILISIKLFLRSKCVPFFVGACAFSVRAQLRYILYYKLLQHLS